MGSRCVVLAPASAGACQTEDYEDREYYYDNRVSAAEESNVIGDFGNGMADHGFRSPDTTIYPFIIPLFRD